MVWLAQRLGHLVYLYLYLYLYFYLYFTECAAERSCVELCAQYEVRRLRAASAAQCLPTKNSWSAAVASSPEESRQIQIHTAHTNAHSNTITNTETNSNQGRVCWSLTKTADPLSCLVVSKSLSWPPGGANIALLAASVYLLLGWEWAAFKIRLALINTD